MPSIQENPTGKDNPNRHRGNHRMFQTVVTVQKSTNLDMLIAQLMSPYATNVDTLDTGKQNAEEVPLLAGSLTRLNPPGGTDNKGRKVGQNLVDLDEYDSQYDEIDLHTVNDNLDEIKVDDMVEPQKTEAYTIVHLPTSNNGKTNASVRVKVDTGAGGNIMPLQVFEHLHPRKMDQNGKPIGLEASKT